MEYGSPSHQHANVTALWTFEDVQPSSCYNIAMQLKNSVDVIEKEFCNICQEFPLNATAMFTYSMVGSEVCLNLNLRQIYFVRFS